MKKALWGLGAVFAALSLTLPAKAWPVDDINKIINQTNFILDTGCSGTLISLKYKLVLTNHHCVEDKILIRETQEANAEGEVKKIKREDFLDLTLTQRSYQGFRRVGESSYQAIIVAHKKKLDLALLQLRADAIPQTEYSRVLQDGKVVVRGDRVYVVGNPIGLDANLTSGIVSSTTRMLRVPWADDAEVPFIQVDAGINPGNSGGALYNDEGYLIGVPAVGARGLTGIGLAIPYTLIRELLDGACYGDVWNTKADDHDACVKAKEEKAKKKVREEKSD